MNTPAVASSGVVAHSQQEREHHQQEHREAPAEGTVQSSPVDAAKCTSCGDAVLRGEEDPSVGVKYLANVLRGDYKYRCIRKANHTFFSEVWLNAGMRGIFLALGFVDSGGWVTLDPLREEAVLAIESTIRELARRTGKERLTDLLAARKVGTSHQAPAHTTSSLS